MGEHCSKLVWIQPSLKVFRTTTMQKVLGNMYCSWDSIIEKYVNLDCRLQNLQSARVTQSLSLCYFIVLFCGFLVMYSVIISIFMCRYEEEHRSVLLHTNIDCHTHYLLFVLSSSLTHLIKTSSPHALVFLSFCY